MLQGYTEVFDSWYPYIKEHALQNESAFLYMRVDFRGFSYTATAPEFVILLLFDTYLGCWQEDEEWHLSWSPWKLTRFSTMNENRDTLHFFSKVWGRSTLREFVGVCKQTGWALTIYYRGQLHVTSNPPPLLHTHQKPCLTHTCTGDSLDNAWQHLKCLIVAGRHHLHSSSLTSTYVSWYSCLCMVKQ